MKESSGGFGAQPDDAALLRRIYAAARGTWLIAAVAAICVLIAASGTLFLLRSSVPATTTYLARFEFKFQGVESGRFPNGDRFSLNEIIEPAVIGSVYDRFKLDQYHIERDEFFNALSIKPYVPQEAEITERFQQQLADRRLTLTERERIEARLKSVLDQASRNGAEVSLTIRRTFGIPSELGRSIVQTIPQVWSQYAIEKRGVLRLPSFTASDVAISMQAVEGAPLPVGIVMLMYASDRLQTRLALSSRIPGIQTLVESASRRSFRDLENAHHDLEVFQVSPLVGALSLYTFEPGLEDVRLLIQQRIADLRTEESYNSGIANAFSANIAQLVESVAALKGRTEVRRGGGDLGSPQSSGTATMPQLSEGFLDKLVEMSARGRDADENLQRRISELTARQLETTEKLVAIKTEQGKWQALLDKLASREQRAVPSDADRNRLKESLVAASTTLNRQWDTLNNLEAEFAANRLSHTADLYSLFLTKPDVIRYDPFLNLTVVSLLLAISLFIFLAVWTIRATILITQQKDET